MAYEKQGFYAGEKLKASQLDAMEDGIIEAERLAQEGAAGAANMEKGTGENATQQVPRPDKVNLYNDQGQLCFEGDNPFIGEDDDLTPYGAIGKSSVSLGGRSCAAATHSMAINSKTIALGEESFATGYATIAAGGASFSGGSQTVAAGSACVALGHKSLAEAPYTFTYGVHTIAGATYQTVFGVANDNDSNNIFEIGNGMLDEAGNIIGRANAFYVTYEGRAFINPRYEVTDVRSNELISLSMANSWLATKISLGIGTDFDKTSVQQKGCSATKINSVALGLRSEASGDVAFAEGLDTKASGYYSHAGGLGTIASGVAQTAVGKYNKENMNAVFVVGTGSSDTDRRNGLQVLTNGDAIVYWNGGYYNLNSILTIISNTHGGATFFDDAKYTY